MALGRRVAAEEAEQASRRRRPRVHHAFWPESRQPPRASSRTARLWMPARSLPALGSDHPCAQSVLARRHARQDAVLLLGRAEVKERRREQEDPVLGDALGRTRGVVLLLEDEPLDEAGVASPVASRPRRRPPSGPRRGASPSGDAARNPRRCRPTGADRAGRSPRARRGPRGGSASSAGVYVRSIAPRLT